MSSPSPHVDWAALTPRLRNGDLVCPTHGLVDAETVVCGLLACPHCHQMVSRATHDRQGVLRGFVEVAPAYCAGDERHKLIGGEVSLGWRACSCSGALPGPGGHRRWTCRTCDPPSEVSWPPCTA